MELLHDAILDYLEVAGLEIQDRPAQTIGDDRIELYDTRDGLRLRRARCC